MNELVLIDTHAHFYRFCTMPEFFDSAYANMSSAAERIAGRPGSLILCLLETESSDWYAALLDDARRSGALGHWRLEIADGGDALELSGEPGERLLVVPGRQLISSENLEVIVVGLRQKPANRAEARQFIEKYGDRYLVILPWGVGKWLGARGRIVTGLMDDPPAAPFVLGDNRGRGSWWRYVPQFRQAKRLGINILPGSDPLPLTGQHEKVGSYGAVVEARLERDGILPQVRELLLGSSRNRVEAYGRLDGLLEFLSSQLMVRLRPIR